MQSNANFLLGKCPTFLFNKERQMSVVKKKKKHNVTFRKVIQDQRMHW